ncbi:MAG: nucleotide sugar dehydrogenase, partial [Magnetococcales bacterium]|nr:nucleotide sugar dehydrogenase [Magnetococcales bacterium]
GHDAMLINEGLIIFIVEQLKNGSITLENETVGLLGMAFKPEVDDIRSSLSYKMKKILRIEAKEVLTTDPFVQDDPELLPLEEVIQRSDRLILCVPHKAYKSLDLKGKPVMDVWGYFR